MRPTNIPSGTNWSAQTTGVHHNSAAHSIILIIPSSQTTHHKYQHTGTSVLLCLRLVLKASSFSHSAIIFSSFSGQELRVARTRTRPSFCCGESGVPCNPLDTSVFSVVISLCTLLLDQRVCGCPASRPQGERVYSWLVYMTLRL